MLMQRRCFSSTPVTLAKRRQKAIQRKKANIARQIVLKAERSPSDFDPIVGTSTDFTRALLTPAAVWSSNTKIQDALYFPKEQITQIQSAVEKAFAARERADLELEQASTLEHKATTGSSVPRQANEALSTYHEAQEKLLVERLDKISLTNEKNSEASSRIVSLQNSNARTLRAYNTAFAISQFQRKDGDTGSAEVQAAVLTARILAESAHVARNKKDNHGYRGFRGLVHQRQKILKYLRRESAERYFSCIERLGLTDRAVVTEIIM